MKPGLGTKQHSPEGICGKTTPRSPHVQPSPYLCRRCPRGAVFQTWAAALPCCGALSPAKKEEHIESPEMPQMLGCCLTALKTKIIFHLKKIWQVAVQGPIPAVSIIGANLWGARYSHLPERKKGGRLCALSCSKLFFLLKVCMLTLLPWTRPVAPFSCLSPDEVGKEGVRKWQVLVGLSADMGLLAETHSGLAGKASVGISLGEKKHSESLHILLYCQPGSYRPLLPSWLTCAHLHHSILIPATMVHLTACLLHHPYPRGLDQSCERIWENWEQDCSLAPVLQGHWPLASVLLLLGDKLTVSVEIASRTTNLLTPSIPKCFTCSPPHQNTASSIRTRSSSQRANDLLQKNKVKNCH